MPVTKVTALLLLLSLAYHSNSQTTPLYPAGIPNSKPGPDEEKTEQTNGITIVSKISIPTLTRFLPAREKANGAAVIIFPGGGYWVNAISHEGTDVARKLNEWGIAAFVVKYRIPDDATMIDPSIGPLQDAQQAMLTVRSRAKEFGIDENRIGIMGFSAGGHLASTLGTHYQRSLVTNPGNISLRPDFMILLYPVISSDTTISHHGSFEKLLGKNASNEKLREFSNEMQVTPQTAPTFLVHATDDDAVPVLNSIVFYEALLRNKVPAELHIYQRGGHGFGMNNKTTSDSWMERCRNWISANGWMKKL